MKCSDFTGIFKETEIGAASSNGKIKPIHLFIFLLLCERGSCKNGKKLAPDSHLVTNNFPVLAE